MGGCKSCSKCFVLFFVYMLILNYFKMYGVWRWANEWDTRCGYPELGANQSGIKALVAGFAKTGTWTMTSSLYKIGYEKSFHCQEYLYHVFSPIVDDYFLRPENGGRRFPADHTINAAMGRHHNHTNEVFAQLKTETLAAYASRCRIDAVAFDGIENLFWITLDASPDAKVILLDWRPHHAWLKSYQKFAPKIFITQTTTELLWRSIFGLPWGLLLKAYDALSGKTIENLHRTAGPAFLQNCPPSIQLWQTFINQRYIQTHWFTELTSLLDDKTDANPYISETNYRAYFEEVIRRVPPERLMRFDFSKHRFEDICAFLEIKDCAMTGEVKMTPNFYAWDAGYNCDEPVALIPIYLVLHVINWKVYGAFLSMVLGLYRAVRVRAKTD